MNIIQEQASIFAKIVGEQSLKSASKYRRFTFCSLLEYKNKNIVYNSFSNQLCILTEEEMNLLNEDIINYSPEIAQLIHNWFLVPITQDDVLLVKQFNNVIMSFKESGINNYTILPTTDCNARCFYCYESGVKKSNMTTQVANDIVNYIEKKSVNKVSIRWFGGEPLVNKKVISTITQKLKQDKVDFSSSMVSNGYLFSYETIKEAKDIWNLTNVQITLDGTEKTYNKTKHYIYNSKISPYKVVLQNIINLLKAKIKVLIRLNMNLNNSQDLFQLVDELHKELNGYSGFNIYVHLLYEDSGVIQYDYTDEKHMELTLKYMELIEYIETKGILMKSILPKSAKSNSCMADKDSAIVITPTGNITKCEHYIDEEIIGNIYSDKLSNEKILSWKERIQPIEKCRKCEIYPQCKSLKKCPTKNKHDCLDWEQTQKIKTLKQSMINFYEKSILGD